MINLDERSPDPLRRESIKQQQASNRLRVAIPGIVQSYDASQQTVTVQVALREKLSIDGNENWVDIPLLLDVPIIFPSSGGHVLTLPITSGDEVLVVFGDCCIDAWWQSGGVQNQIDTRRHDLSDAFAIPGPWSQPRRVSGYSTNSAQLRNEAGSAYVEIKGGDVNIVADEINLSANKIHLDAGQIGVDAGSYYTHTKSAGGSVEIDGVVTISGNKTTIDGKNFLQHVHTDVEPGGGTTGGVS